MTFPETDGEESCLAFASGNFLSPSGVPLCCIVGMAGFFFCLLDKGSFPMLCSSTVSPLCQASEQRALECSPLG